MVAIRKIPVDDADTSIATALRAVGDTYGWPLKPDDVVRVARNPASPLHRCFQWNNEDAAESWRLEQARRLIHDVRIEMTVNTLVIEAYAYVRDPSLPAAEQGYLSVERVRDQPATGEAVIDAEVRRIVSLIDRTRQLAQSFDCEQYAERALRKALA